MSDELKSMMNDLLKPDVLQPKVDILESNITGDLIASTDELEAVTIIQREGTGAVTEILDKAIKQFFTNVNIPEAVIGSKLFNALEKKSDEEITLTFSIQDHPRETQTRTVEVVVAKTLVKISIKGYAAVKPIHESIAKFYFNHGDYPGKVLPNGKFDYRELHKFPSVKQNDNILFVRYPVPGKPGITYSGRHLVVNEPKNFDLKIKDGVIKEEVLNPKGEPVGYFLKAVNDGVIIITKTNNVIREIDVSNEIKLDKIDFSTGNIGSEFKSPVSMEIGEISSEFKVNVDGRIKVTDLNGGIVSTNQNAVAENVRNNSKITAQQNIKSKNVTDSFMESIHGSILIEGEIRDSTLKSPIIHLLSQKSLVLNTTIFTRECILQGGYYCGVNTIIFGKDLFLKRIELSDKQNEIEIKKNQISKAISEIKANLVPALKDLSSQIKDEETMNQYKILIRYFQSLEFDETYKILDNLRKKLNVMQIDSVKKSFENLNALSTKQLEVEEFTRQSVNELGKIEAEINKIKFHIKGEINPTATIKLFCTKRVEEDEQPVFEVKSKSNEKNETIDISGSYNLKDGFVVN